MVKEELLTFEGKPLFPERIAETVPYQLSDGEKHLYDEVTRYVREEMNRAERLGSDNPCARTVGFALTVLQRRLASSTRDSALLQRRRERLEAKRQEMLNPASPRWKTRWPTCRGRGWRIPTNSTPRRPRISKRRSSTRPRPPRRWPSWVRNRPTRQAG